MQRKKETGREVTIHCRIACLYFLRPYACGPKTITPPSEQVLQKEIIVECNITHHFPNKKGTCANWCSKYWLIIYHWDKKYRGYEDTAGDILQGNKK